MYPSRRSHHKQNVTISMQPQCGIPIHHNTYTRGHHRRYRYNPEPNTPPPTRRLRTPLGHAKQHVQREALPMGSSISGILGNHIHGKTRNHRPLLGPNDKPLQEIFLDDIYLQTTNEETADDFHHIINNVHPNLKFEIEKPETTPSGLSLSLLGFQSHHILGWQQLF